MPGRGAHELEPGGLPGDATLATPPVGQHDQMGTIQVPITGLQGTAC